MSTPIRNIAIIAHVDHGKTTLVDAMLRQAGTFRANEALTERVMDSNELEKERGITILAKNTAIQFQDTKINIVDTPGHADFGGEVERALKMVDGVMLLVDASEGPLPQTRYVLSKALEAKLPPILVINKIDRPDARAQGGPQRGLRPLHRSRRGRRPAGLPRALHQRQAGHGQHRPRPSPERTCSRSLKPSLHHPAGQRRPRRRRCRSWSPTSTTPTTWGAWPSRACSTEPCTTGTRSNISKRDGSLHKTKITKLFTFNGLKRTDTEETQVGDIVAIAGVTGITIGETITGLENPAPLPLIVIDEPTIAMQFSVNNSPMAGREGQYVTSRNLRERLDKELLTNVSIRVEETGSPDSFKVLGRGELQLAILIEMMRREGFELMVGAARDRHQDASMAKSMEPVEHLTIDVPDNFVGTVIERLGPRQGRNGEDAQSRLRTRAPGVPRSQPRPDRPAQRDAHRNARHHRDECAL